MYQNFRNVMRDLYEICGEYLGVLYDFIEFLFQPLRVSLEQLSLDPTGITGILLDVVNWFTKNALGELSIASIMIGAGVIVYFAYTIAKWIADIIF